MWTCYNCNIGAIGDLEIFQAYDKLCENQVLKEKFQIDEKKSLTHALVFPIGFKTEWTRIVLSRIHNGCLWLEGETIKITKRIVHRVTRFPTLDPHKTLCSDSKEVIEKNTKAQWNKRGMTIDKIIDPLLDFLVRVTFHKFYH